MSWVHVENKHAPEAQCSFEEALLKRFVKYTTEELFQHWAENLKHPDGSFISEIVHHSESNNKDKPMLYCDRWVWLQGFMVDIAEDCDVFQISDHVPEPEASISQATTCVLVVNCNRTAGKIDKSAKGKYFQGKNDVIKAYSLNVVKFWVSQTTSTANFIPYSVYFSVGRGKRI